MQESERQATIAAHIKLRQVAVLHTCFMTTHGHQCTVQEHPETIVWVFFTGDELIMAILGQRNIQSSYQFLNHNINLFYV